MYNEDFINYDDFQTPVKIDVNANLLYVSIIEREDTILAELTTLEGVFNYDAGTTDKIQAECNALSGAIRYAIENDIDATIYVSLEFYQYYKAVVIMPNHEKIDAMLDLIYKAEQKHFRAFPVQYAGERYLFKTKRIRVAITPTEKMREIWTKDWRGTSNITGEYGK